MVESLVASHLARKFGVGYWKNRREIDLVVRSEGLTGIEVKYGRKPLPSRIRVGKIKAAITLSKDAFNKEPLMVPVCVFLACLNVRFGFCDRDHHNYKHGDTNSPRG